MPITEEELEQLQIAVDVKLKKMFEDKKQTPKLLIPKQLPSFVKTPLFRQFLESIYEYCINFNTLMKQYDDLKEKMATRINDQASLLNKEKQSLAKLQRQLSYQYAAIIVAFNSQCIEQDKKRSNYKDQVFFQALIYLVERVIKQQFNREDFVLIQQEINRLFRTNRYNLIKKRHDNDKILQKYPALKEQKQKNKTNLTSILTRAPDRINAFKKFEKDKKVNQSYDYTETLGIIKEPKSPDMQQRSPLLCTWLPSRKSMITDFNESSKYNKYLQVKRNTHNTITTITTEEARTRMASVGNNVITNHQY